MTPKYRQWLYTVAAVASALIPILVAYKVIDTAAAGAWVNLIGVLGGLGTVGASTAAVMTAKQRKDGTLDFTGTPAQQAIDAIQATVSQAGTASGELQRVITAATDLIAGGGVIAGPILDAVRSATSTDPASADYQP